MTNTTVAAARSRLTCFQTWITISAVLLVAASSFETAAAAQLMAGAAKVDITNPNAAVDGPLHARALVIKSGDTTAVLVTLDVVSLGEIGYVSNEYLGDVRSRLEKELNIKPTNVIINTSHCHGIPCDDIDDRTVQAVKAAAAKLVPVKVGVGAGSEDRVQQNRRLKLKSGKVLDERHAYSLPANDEVAEVGPIDPQIGVLRLDAEDGRTVAVVYNFACHPIMGVPTDVNTADMTGFSSQVIENNLSAGTIALFVQGCAGDIDPIDYKRVDRPRNAEALGNILGLSTLKAVRNIKTKSDDRMIVVNEKMELPRADLAQRMVAMEEERQRLLDSLNGTFLNLETFVRLAVKYNLSNDFPSNYAYRYLQEDARNREGLRKLDATNRARLKSYIRNVRTMEQLTRINTNLRLLRKHQQQLVDAGKRTIEVELVGLRVGDFVLTTFPGELTVPIGLGIKKRSPHEWTFVAGYTNGYIYYCPTAEQLKNVGGAQEDSDCLLAPEWQKLYEDKAADILRRL